jgi:multidrug efflux pump subunit AcrB
VQNRVAQAVAQLPTEAQQNGVQVRKRATNLMMGVSLYSPLNTHTPLFVSNYASTQVREALSRLPGVGQVQMFGARDYSMRIWLRPDRMNALNVTTDDVPRRCASRTCRARRARWARRRCLTASSRR